MPLAPGTGLGIDAEAHASGRLAEETPGPHGIEGRQLGSLGVAGTEPEFVSTTEYRPLPSRMVCGVTVRAGRMRSAVPGTGFVTEEGAGRRFSFTRSFASGMRS